LKTAADDKKGSSLERKRMRVGILEPLKVRLGDKFSSGSGETKEKM
jgi:hypothetical protein